MDNQTFRTVVEIPPSENPISYTDKIVLCGSCFAENIGQRLGDHKFKVLINPFGIQYHPLAITHSFERIIQQREYTEEELVLCDEKWHSLDHHGKFSGSDRTLTLQGINRALREAHHELANAKYLILTFGTAYAYEYLEESRLVANCHKIPAKEFRRRVLEHEEIHDHMSRLLLQLRSFNPSLNIGFTVSPIRHWKDGAVANQRSKALLISAVHQLIDEFAGTFYFPAYELQMDDLRDYRFYASDLIHPNELAIDYIWQRFQESMIHESCREPMKKILQLKSAADHRPFDPESNSFQRFVQKHLDFIDDLEKIYPFFDLSPERAHFEALKL